MNEGIISTRATNIKKKGNHGIALHLALICGITALVVLCIIYPFLHGEYDGWAVPLSTMAQVFGVFGLMPALIGVLWFVYEVRKRARQKSNLPTKNRRYSFVLASVIAFSIVVVPVSLVAIATIGISIGFLILVLWLYMVLKLISKLKLLKNTESKGFNPVPLYLILIPVATLFFQLTFASFFTEFSSNKAIAQSVTLINDIEKYHARNGCYPSSLLAVWNDYTSSVVGIEGYHYEPNGEAYNLFFEQPRFLLDNIGTREFVVYNPRDEQTMISHDGWILLLTPEEIRTSQGWYAVHNAALPHWKYFWFD